MSYKFRSLSTLSYSFLSDANSYYITLSTSSSDSEWSIEFSVFKVSNITLSISSPFYWICCLSYFSSLLIIYSF